MQFLGLLMMKNLVKPESAKAINVLRMAHLRTVMVTGKIYLYQPQQITLCTSFCFIPSCHELNAINVMSNLVFVLHTGDNILTAVNVAKSCGMVGSDEKVIFVNATPPTAQSMATLRFSLEGGGDTAAQSSIEIVTRVSPAQTQHHSTLLLSMS